MSKARNISNLFSASTDLSTDAEVTAALSTHSSAADPHSVYLKESEYTAAGKNYLINGAFDFWQRGTTFTSPSNWTHSADRWLVGAFSGAIGSVTQQALTPGEIPDFDGAYFIRIATGTATDLDIIQKIEDVRKMAGKTVTLSFWTRTSTATNSSFDYTEFAQNFGSGGSGSVATGHSSVLNGTWGTSWTRCSVTINVPSISGKTIGTNSHIQFRIDINNSFSGNWDITGVQLEIGAAATTFSRAGGTIGGELSLCQRYYFAAGWKLGKYANSYQYSSNYYFKSMMRTSPTIAFADAVGNVSKMSTYNSSDTRTDNVSPLTVSSTPEILVLVPNNNGTGAADVGMSISFTASAEL